MESLSKTSKEDTALKVLKQSPIQEGLICAISTVELCSTLQPFLNLETGKLELKNVTRKCKYYYLYFQDNVFGFMHVKIQSWFPFMMQVYINGRGMHSTALNVKMCFLLWDENLTPSFWEN